MEPDLLQLDAEQVIKNCLIYARVSTERQVQEGHSLDDQVNRLVQYARDHGYHILEVYKDGGKSASSTTGRPEFTRMLERCQEDRDVHAVILEETDRFARNAQDHLAVKSLLKKHNVQLIATQQPNFGDDPVGKFVDLVMAGANQLQREITGEKTKRTMVALAEKGIQPGPARLGYVNSFQKGIPWKVDPDKSYFIKEMFRRFINGESPSIYTLEEELYAEGFRNRHGGKVYASAIHLMLTNVIFAGKVHYKGKIYDGQHEALVSMDDIQKAEAILKKHNKGADRSRKHNWPLAGMVYCKTSEDLMTGEQHIKKNGLIFRHYRCLGPKNRGKKCDEPYAPMDRIHKQLEKHITSIKFGKRFLNGLRTELLEVMKNQGMDIPSQIEALEKRKQTVDGKMTKLEDQMIGELIPQERIKERYIPLKDELKAIEAELAKLRKPSANLDEQMIEEIIKFLKNLPRLWKAFNKIEQKQFLKYFVEKIWIQNKDIVEITYTEAFQAIIDRDMVRIKAAQLPEPHFLIPVDYAPTVQPMFNVGYFGEMKQRWEEIKRIQHSRMNYLR